jgi:ribosomal protein L7/L12
MDDRVRNLALEGKKIEAIKLYREMTGLGLKEAKDAVEGMEVDDAG